jgi:hypothetical protein
MEDAMRKRLCVTVLGILPWVATAADEEVEFTEEFPLEDCLFVPYGGNDYFSLNAGRQTYFSNNQCVATGECDELEELTITVTRQTKKIFVDSDHKKRPIWTRVVEEFETANGEVAEISRNFFATCLPSRDVYYFGEDVDIYEDGEIVSHEGAWLAGRNGAEPGIIMPDSGFLLGQRYFQEMAPGVALDRAEHVGNDLEISVGAGNFDDCIEVQESTPTSPSGSVKFYCPRVGLVIDGDLEAIAVYR